jgi:hypothetical protein
MCCKLTSSCRNETYYVNAKYDYGFCWQALSHCIHCYSPCVGPWVNGAVTVTIHAIGAYSLLTMSRQCDHMAWGETV